MTGNAPAKPTLKRDGYRCRRCGKKGSRRNPLQANHMPALPPDRDRVTHFKSRYRRRTQELWGWLLIIALLLAYALIHGAR